MPRPLFSRIHHDPSPSQEGILMKAKKVHERSSPTRIPAVRPGPTYRARPLRREFVTTVVDEVYVESGFGLTLDQVLDGLIGLNGRGLMEAVESGDPDDPCYDDPRSFDDSVIWEGTRVVAVARMAGDGGGMEIVRFDGPDSAPGGTQVVRFAASTEGGDL